MIRDEEVARRIERDVLGILQGGAGCRAAIAGEAGLPGAGYRRDGAAGVDLADDVVTRIGDEDVAGRIEGHVSRAVQLRRGGRTAVARIAARGGSGEYRLQAARGVEDVDI